MRTRTPSPNLPLSRIVGGSLGTLLLSFAIVALLTVSLSIAGLADNSRVGDGTEQTLGDDGNLIGNPSFERNLDGWNAGTSPLDDWNPTWEQTTDDHWAGTGSARVTVTDNTVTQHSTSYLEYQTPASVVAGEPYLFSALSKTTNSAFLPTLRIAWFDADNNYLQVDLSEPTDTARSANQWIIHEYPVIPPPGAAIAYLRLQIQVDVSGLTGTTWWDAVRFVPLNTSATPVSDESAEASPSADVSPAASPESAEPDGAVGKMSDLFTISVFARDLPFPYGLAELPDGSLLVGTSDPGQGGYLTSSGQLLRLVDADGDDVADDAGQTLFSGLPGTLTDVRVAGQLVFATSADDHGERFRISILRLDTDLSAPMVLLGSLDFGFTSDRLHKSYGLAIRPTPGAGGAGRYDLVFNVGSVANDEVGDPVSVSGLTSGTLESASLYMVTVNATEPRLRVSEPVQIAAGLRNAAGLTFDPASGDLLITDNGVDLSGDADIVPSADELNRIPAGEIGGDVENFGFPDSYVNLTTGARVGLQGIGPEVAFGEDAGPAAVGAAQLAVAPAGFPDGFNDGVVIGFHGIWDAVGTDNPSNPLLFVDRATGEIRTIITARDPAIGHLDGVLTTEDALYVADLTGLGSLHDTGATGVIYVIRSRSEGESSRESSATPDDAAESATPTPDSANAATVRQFFANLATDNRSDALNQIVAPDAVFHLNSSPDHADLGAFLDANATVQAAMTEPSFTVESLIDQGDTIGARWTFQATDSGSGSPVEMTGISLFRFTDQRIGEYWEATDRYGLRQQLAGPNPVARSVAASTASTVVDPESAKVLVLRWYDEVWNHRNVALVNLLFSGDFVDHADRVGNVQSSRCADFGGCRAGLKQLVYTNVCGFPDLQYTVDDQIAAGDLVVTRWTLKGMQSGPFVGVSATGKSVAVAGMDIDRIAEGQIVERWSVSDLDGLLTQLGVEPLPTRVIDGQPLSGPLDLVIQQPSFEHGLDGWIADAGSPANWDPTWSLATDDATDGQSSAAVTVSTGDAINAPAWLQSCPFAVDPNQEYIFSAESKTTNPIHAPLLRIIFFDANGTYIADASEAMDVSQPINRWTPHRFTVTSPANAVAAAVRLQINAHLSTKTVWNPSFEQGTNGWAQGTTNPTAWNPTWSRTTADAQVGVASAQMSVTVNDISEPSETSFQYRLSGIVPSERYLFSAQARTSDPGLAPSLEIVWFNAQGQEIGYDVEPPRSVERAKTWSRHEFESVAPPNAVEASIRLVVHVSQSGTSGTTLWDSVIFEPVTPIRPAPNDAGASLVGTTWWDGIRFERAV